MPAYRVREDEFRLVGLVVDGISVTAMEGDTVAAVILASCGWHIRTTREGQKRGPLCLMGACQECLATIDGMQNQRTCMHTVTEGMRVQRA